LKVYEFLDLDDLSHFFYEMEDQGDAELSQNGAFFLYEYYGLEELTRILKERHLTRNFTKDLVERFIRKYGADALDYYIHCQACIGLSDKYVNEFGRRLIERTIKKYNLTEGPAI